MKISNFKFQISKKGFTLIELVVVIAIISILAVAGTYSYSHAQRKARDAKRRQDAKELINALELYNSRNGSYPTTSSSWVGSTPTSSSQFASNLNPLVTGSFMSAVSLDPKNIDSPELKYYYVSDGTNYCIQVSQENNPGLTDPNLVTWPAPGQIDVPPDGKWNGVWHLRYGDINYCQKCGGASYC